MSRASFYKWLKAFKDGPKSIADDSRSRKPVGLFTPESVQAVKNMIRSDKRVYCKGEIIELPVLCGVIYWWSVFRSVSKV